MAKKNCKCFKNYLLFEDRVSVFCINVWFKIVFIFLNMHGVFVLLFIFIYHMRLNGILLISTSISPNQLADSGLNYTVLRHLKKNVNVHIFSMMHIKQQGVHSNRYMRCLVQPYCVVELNICENGSLFVRSVFWLSHVY